MCFYWLSTFSFHPPANYQSCESSEFNQRTLRRETYREIELANDLWIKIALWGLLSQSAMIK